MWPFQGILQKYKRNKENDAVAKAIIASKPKETHNPITGQPYDAPLIDEHPELDLALMYAQPGNALAKVLAPSMAKGITESLISGDTEGLLASMVPGGAQIKKISGATKSLRPITEAERLGIPKIERNANIKESTLNWSWQDWFKDRINDNGHIKPTEFDKQSLYKHIPEYRQIEIKTKRDGTYLKMPDGSIFEGDPREWVMAQSKAAQGLNFTDYYGLGSGQKPGYTIYFERQRNAPTMIDEIKGNFEGTPGRPAWLTDFKKAEGFANDGRGIGYTYKVYPQKGDSRAYFDLQGLDWDSIPVNVVKELNIPEGSGFVSTNRIISESPAQVIHLNNVAEGSGGASNIVNDVVIKGKRKSILGNNGNFNWEDEVVWRKQGGKIKSIF